MRCDALRSGLPMLPERRMCWGAYEVLVGFRIMSDTDGVVQTAPSSEYLGGIRTGRLETGVYLAGFYHT